MSHDREIKLALTFMLVLLALVIGIGAISSTGCGRDTETPFVPTPPMQGQICYQDTCRNPDIKSYCKLDKTRTTCPSLKETVAVVPVAGWTKFVMLATCGTVVRFTNPTTGENTDLLFEGEDLVGVVQEISFSAGSCKQSFYGRNLFCCQ